MAKLSKNQKCLFSIHLLRGIMELFTNTFLTSHIITSITSDNVLGAGLYNSAIFYIAQYVFYALIYVAASFFVKRYNRAIFLQLSIFVNLGLIIGLARSLSFYYYEKNDKEAPLYLAIILSLLTLASYFIINLWILGDAKPVDVLCLVALVSYVFIFRIRDIKKVRFLMLAPTALSILFNVLSSAAIFATLTYVFELSANVISILKYHVIKVEQKK